MLFTLLVGHTAEDLIFNEVSTGAHSDIEQATRLARKMVTDYGMSRSLGPRTFGHKEELVFLGREISEQRDYSEKVARQIDDEVHNIIQQAHELAKKILSENKERLVFIAEKLVAQETLEGEALEAALSEPIPSSPAETIEPPATSASPTPPKSKSEVKKTRAVPQLHPKPAPSD
jgi:cell division protease FtsH